MNEQAFIQQGSLTFRPHARLIRLLGNELISDEVMAVVELVKNGYDADASLVLVKLQNVTSSECGSIVVSDNGHGMDLHRLLNVWMEPATSYKRGEHHHKVRTLKGRVQLGEKGVGRFAADKLGAELELVTRIAEADEELVLQLNWNAFDNQRYLDDVKISWFSRKPVVFSESSHGTLLKIQSLRASWHQEMVDKLNTGLIRLLSPSSGATDFTIELLCPEFPTASGKLVNRLLETAPYTLSGSVNTSGILQIESDAEQDVDLKPLCHNHFETAPGGNRDPVCGAFAISLYVWDLELQVGKGFGVDKTLREAIKSSSGVSIYRDGFRIWPYGEKDDDWLELNQRRVNNPTLRISNNQVIGFIEITHADNPDLQDRTSREGLIDTRAFFDLKALALAAIEELEAIRFKRRHQVVSPTALKEDDDELLQLLGSFQGHQAANRIPLKEIEKLYRRRMEQEQSRYSQVSAMAGVGLAAELLSEAFSKEVGDVGMLLRILQGQVQVAGDTQVQQLVAGLSKHMKVINEQLDMIDPLYHPHVQNNEPLDVKAVAYDVISTLRHKLVETHTNVSIYGSQSLIVRMGRGHLMMSLLILIDNAIKTMKEASVKNPCIDIQIITEEKFYGILIGDNGPGINEKHRKLIFEPSFTLRKAGRGLGLHIARDILGLYTTSLDVSTKRSVLAGACFEIRFDKRRIISESLK